ncbi:MAG TPA: LytTR family DNA-binding domain-containing protein [Polyangiaceae bacterium]|nr:LytTR family DNA-binding domain-containing protein [Polyangiaceae bacterium]
MLRCFIADDEPLARERLRRLLSGMPDVTIAGEAGDGVSTLEQLGANTADVVLLDIQMPELDGLAVASALAASDQAPAIVFITAYDEHALAAFELAALDYLVKPVSEERLATALGRARRARALPQTSSPSSPLSGLPAQLSALLARLGPAQPVRRMAVRCGAKLVVFDPSRAHALVARDHYSAILIDGGELLADDPLERLAQRFDPNVFLRIHRSAFINLSLLRELVHEGDRRYVAVLGDAAGTRIPVSRERLPALKAALGLS